MLLDFSNWIISEVVKDARGKYQSIWGPKFASLSRQNKFSHWFDASNRIYLPISVDEDEVGFQLTYANKEYREKIEEALNSKNYKILDWRNDKVELERPGQITTISNALYKAGFNKLREDYLEWLSGRYGGVRLNKTNNKFYIVISNDPHDLAKQSTARSWQSCNTLPIFDQETLDEPKDDMEKNTVYQKLAKEVQEGGLIAYLVDEKDRDINNPLARINLRRYEDPIKGDTFIYCSDNRNIIYGKQGTDFILKYVIQWLENKQTNKKMGLYNLKGGDWTEPTKKEIFHSANELNKKTEQYYKKAINYYYKNKSSYNVEEFVYDALRIMVEKKSLGSPEFWNWLKEFILSRKVGFYGGVQNQFLKILELFPGSITADDLLRLDKKIAKDIVTDVYGKYKTINPVLEKEFLNKIFEIIDNNEKDIKILLKWFDYFYPVSSTIKYDENMASKVMDWLDNLYDENIQNKKLIDKIGSAFLEIGDSYNVEKNYKKVNKFLEKSKNNIKFDEMDLKAYFRALEYKKLDLPAIS